MTDAYLEDTEWEASNLEARDYPGTAARLRIFVAEVRRLRAVNRALHFAAADTADHYAKQLERLKALAIGDLSDDDLREIYKVHCECRPLDVNRTDDEHSHDCDLAYCAVVRELVRRRSPIQKPVGE